MGRKSLFSEQTVTISTRLPESAVFALDKEVSSGLYRSRAEALRDAALIGLASPEWQEKCSSANPGFAAQLAALRDEVQWSTGAARLREYLARMEEPLSIALGGNTEASIKEAKRLYNNVLQRVKAFPGFWQEVAKKFMEESPVYVKAKERFGVSL